ncbi:MAG: 23S rRNA (uracil(1939)-C(5))-methyltransferase RlmD [Negativicutes bacterium]
MNNTYEVTIDNYGHSGEGVGRVGGKPVFVSGAIVGERLLVRNTENKKSYSRAKIVEILDGSPERVTPRCVIYERCGGCQLQHLSYAEQLRMKRSSVVNAIVRIGGLDESIIGAILPDMEEFGYRNKMQLPVQHKHDRLVAGFFAQGTHTVIDMENCPIQHNLNDQIAACVKKIAKDLDLHAYDERTGRGWLRHIIGRAGVNTGEAMVVLVTAMPIFHQKNEFVRRVREALPQVVSIVQIVNSQNTNVILGVREIVLWGKNHITEAMCGLNFELSAKSFFQVNTHQAERLYAVAKQAAQLQPDDILLDAYCGAGAIGLFMANKVKKIVGVDIVASAVENANRNAIINNIANAEYHCGDIAAVLSKPEMEEFLPTVVVVDPPRTGCDENELRIYADKIKPHRIIYVSCNPATLARDLKILCAEQYECLSVTPVDMFPQTYHVESVTVLQRKNS